MNNTLIYSTLSSDKGLMLNFFDFDSMNTGVPYKGTPISNEAAFLGLDDVLGISTFLINPTILLSGKACYGNGAVFSAEENSVYKKGAFGKEIIRSEMFIKNISANEGFIFFVSGANELYICKAPEKLEGILSDYIFTDGKYLLYLKFLITTAARA